MPWRWYHSVMSVHVLKADGTIEQFNIDKLKQSLRRSGANKEEVTSIAMQIEGVLHEGIRTQEIYRHAFELLRQSEQATAARYSLRRALFGLGPTGFPFEDFLSRLFTTEGYTTKTRVTMLGSCVEHELDITAYNDTHSFVAEAKFHARPGIKSDLQVVMYSYARLLDLKNKKICAADVCGIKELMVVTNTKFTHTAETYAECVGVSLLSWTYPPDNNLHQRIERSGLYPITVLQTLSPSQKATLIARGAIVCRDLLERPQILRHVHVSKQRTEAILSEVSQVSHM